MFAALPRAAALAVLCSAWFSAQASAFQLTPYGSGINPPGSLTVLGGTGALGGTLTLGVSNPLATTSTPNFAFLSLATAPDPSFPAGTPLAGFGLSAPGAIGELLLSVVPPNPAFTLGPNAWAGAGAPPAPFPLPIPFEVPFAGANLYAQGLLFDPFSGPSVGFTSGLRIRLAQIPDFPGLVLIPPGTFQMGSDAASGARYFNDANQQPVHQVTISKPFWMGRYEVTQAEYQALMGTNPSQFLGADRPVENVTWFDAVAYCNALNAQQMALGKVPAGYQYRLPTEAEWEYAARAGTTTEFHYGPSLLCNQARFSYSYHSTPAASCNNPQGTVPVGSYAPNAWGLYDMHGNVWEWCMDSWSSYTASAKTDPYVSGGPHRVFRGGSLGSASSSCRSAVRSNFGPGSLSNSLGFRVVLAPVLVP